MDDLVRRLVSQATTLERGLTVSPLELARSVRDLTRCEVRPGGPYARGTAPGVADSTVTEAAARFLAAAGIDLAAPGYRIATPRAPRASPDEGEARVLQAIQDAAERRFAALPQWVATDVRRVVGQTIDGNPDRQMPLMSHYVRLALGEKGAAFDDRLVGEMGLANIFFWTAFIIYDDFWDADEAADPKLLPVANLFARHYTDYFSSFPMPGYRRFFHSSMDALDAANAWETRECRTRTEGTMVHVPHALPEYGSYEIKFYPVAGHVAGPVALFALLDYSPDSHETQQLLAYFRHYLVAMQLNDDSHDWKEDLARGHLSTAVSVLMREWKAVHPDTATFDTVRDAQELEQLFWFKVLDPLCVAIQQHCAQARVALAACTPLQDSAPLLRYIERNERAAAEAVYNRELGDALIKAFS